MERELHQCTECLGDTSRHRKDLFLALLAHELRNPLAPILNGLRVLELADTPPEIVGEVCALMRRQVLHLSRIVEDLLTVARITQGQITLRRESLDWGGLIRTAIADRRLVLEQAGLCCRLEIPATPVLVSGDAVRLTQILDNLLDNAVRFSPLGGLLTVQLTTDSARGQGCLTVRDTGEGIDADLLPFLFEAFAQGDQSLERTRGGLGLGLALVKGLTELHGGQVEAASDGPGRGATFTVRLPLEGEPSALAEPAVPVRPTLGPLRILIIEDNRPAADSLRLFLQLLGHEVSVAYTGPEGLQAALALRPRVVLCDIGLPGMDGYDIARSLRREPTLAGLRLIAVSGYGREEDLQRSQEAGFDYHLVKPADPDILLRLLVAESPLEKVTG
jgi:CheY-like chemotaxis protein